MPAEAQQMGKLSPRLRLTFALATVVCVLALAVSPVKDYRAEWKHYKRWFVKYAQGRPDTKRLLADCPRVSSKPPVEAATRPT